MGTKKDKYKSPPVGHQITAVLFGVPKGVIEDGTFIWQCALRSLEADRFTVLHKYTHAFKPGQGMTGVAVLSESHLHVHTYPEEEEGRSLYFHLYSCLGRGHGEETLRRFLRLVPHKGTRINRIAIPIDHKYADLMPLMPSRKTG